MTTLENPASPAEPTESLDEIGTQVVELLTRAARHRDGTGRQLDFAGFLVPLLGAVTANRGSVWELLSGRPGSWESAGLENLLMNAGCGDWQWLAGYRSAPITIDVPIAVILSDAGRIEPNPDDPSGRGTWRRLLADGEDFDEQYTALEDARDEAQRALEARHPGEDYAGWEAEADQIDQHFDARTEDLRRRWIARYTRYLDAFREAVTTHAATLGLRVPVEVRGETGNPELMWTAAMAIEGATTGHMFVTDGFAGHLYEHAVNTVPMTLLTTDPTEDS